MVALPATPHTPTPTPTPGPATGVHVIGTTTITSHGIEQIFAAAQELARAGDQPASLKFALWIAVCSANQTLYRNGLIARGLAPFVATRLPDRDHLVSLLRACRAFWSGRTLDLLYSIEAAERDGTLAWFEQAHTRETLVQWQEWRSDLVHLCGKGFGYKMASFAALLMYPLTCPFAVIDTHLAHYLGLPGVPKTQRAYLRAESQLAREHAQWMAHTGLVIPLGLYHWHVWNLTRYARGRQASLTPESHRFLAPTWYPVPGTGTSYAPPPAHLRGRIHV